VSNPSTPAPHALPIARNASGADINGMISYIFTYSSGGGAASQGALWPKRGAGARWPVLLSIIGGAGRKLSTVLGKRRRTRSFSGVSSSSGRSLGTLLAAAVATCTTTWCACFVAIHSRGAAAGVGAPLSFLLLDRSDREVISPGETLLVANRLWYPGRYSNVV
jgi:hypothetical protein